MFVKTHWTSRSKKAYRPSAERWLRPWHIFRGFSLLRGEISPYTAIGLSATRNIIVINLLAAWIREMNTYRRIIRKIQYNATQRNILYNQNTLATLARNTQSWNFTNYMKLSPTPQTNILSASQVLRCLDLKHRSNYHFYSMQIYYPILWQFIGGNIRTQTYLT